MYRFIHGTHDRSLTPIGAYPVRVLWSTVAYAGYAADCRRLAYTRSALVFIPAAVFLKDTGTVDVYNLYTRLSSATSCEHEQTCCCWPRVKASSPA